MLRSIPNCNVIRPCDSRETYAAWERALKSQETPTALILSRQNLPILGSKYKDVAKGAYIISKEKAHLDATIIATGSEVSLAVEAQKELFEKGIDVRVVSMPSWFDFDKQSEEYKEQVMGICRCKRFAVEMLSTFGWHKYAAHVMGIDTFGASAPAKDVIADYHFLKEDVVKFVEEGLKE